MYISNCLKPNFITNPHTGDSYFVPCGKCESCLNNRSLTWQLRLTQEIRMYKYLFFITLTYDDDHIHVLNRSLDNRFFIGNDNDVVIPYEDVCEGYFTFGRSKKITNKEYLDSLPFVPILQKKDVSAFMKRLRQHIHYDFITNNIEENEKVRFFACGEYGETTYRPHYHILLWFYSERIAKKLLEYLSKSWDKGNIVAKTSNANVAQYVTKYVNSFGNLPQIYRCECVKPFILFSRSPSIGSCHVSEKEVQNIFFKSSVEMPVFDYQRSKPVYVRLWRSLEDRLFPRCKGFDKTTHFERVGLYGISNEYVAHNATEFVERLTKGRYSLYTLSTYFAFGEVLKREGVFEKRYSKEVAGFVLDLKRKFDFAHLLSRLGYFELSINNEYSSLVRLYYMSRSFCRMCHIYGITVASGVSFVEDHYGKLDFYKLKTQFIYENNALKNKTITLKDLIYLDPVFCKRLREISRFGLSASYRFFLSSLGYSDKNCSPFYTYVDDVRKHFDSRPLTDVLDFKHFKAIHKKIYNDSCKNKAKKDAIEYHKNLNHFTFNPY